MKKQILFSIALLTTGVTYAQTSYDATKYTHQELNGTARYVGMGGAMGALGADLSTMGSNPAGIGLFRSSTASLTFGLNSTQNKADFMGTQTTQNKTKMSFDQVGFVSSTHVGNRSNVRFFNFGFNYQKRNNLNNVFHSAGVYPNGYSQTVQMGNMMADIGITEDEFNKIYDYEKGVSPAGNNPYLIDRYPYLGVMGIRTGLVSLPKEGTALKAFQADKFAYESTETGGIQQFDVNISTNLNDRVYLGATVGAYYIDYKRSTFYKEAIYDGKQLSNGGFEIEGAYRILNDLKTEGTGLDIKLGAIFRPIEDSPFRLGVAIHTPTWYQLQDTYSTFMESDIEYKDTPQAERRQIGEATYDYTNGDNLREYRLTTPWKFNVSAGTIVGGIMAIGAEYELADYSTASLKYNDGVPMTHQNDVIKSTLNAVHTFKVGLETRLTPEFVIRAGYNYTSALFKKGAYKVLDTNDMRTDTEFSNTFARNTFTLGAGYSGKRFYADLAYKFDTTKSDFYTFSSDALAATKVTTDRHQVLCTLGLRF